MREANKMNESNLNEIVKNIMERKAKCDPCLLNEEEMNRISHTDIINLAKKFPFELGFETQWYYYENRKRSDKELLEEVNEQIHEFEVMYHSDFETEFGKLSFAEADGRDDATHYYDWKDLVEQKEILTEKLSNQ